MNKFNLVLSSSGFNDLKNEVSPEAVDLFKKISKNKKVLILANAAPVGDGNYDARVNVQQNFLNIGAIKADIVDISSDNIGKINDYDIVYGLGGNPQHLIELTQKTELKKYLINFLKHGIYIGESAGSMILSKNLKWVYDIKKGTKKKYDIVLDNYQGIGLTTHNIFPHFNKINPEIKQRIKDYEHENNLKISPLTDSEFILEYYQ